MSEAVMDGLVENTINPTKTYWYNQYLKRGKHIDTGEKSICLIRDPCIAASRLPNDFTLTHRRCRKCGEFKPFDNFNKNNSYVMGINYYCNLCLFGKRICRSCGVEYRYSHRTNNRCDSCHSRIVEEKKKKSESRKKYWEIREQRRIMSKFTNGKKGWTTIEVILNRLKNTARRKGFDYDLDDHKEELLELIKPMRCQLSGVPLTCASGEKKPNSASIDRIDSSKGYVWGNVRVIAVCINFALNKWKQDEVFTIMKEWINNTQL